MTPLFETPIFNHNKQTRNLRAKLRNAISDLKWHKENCKRSGLLNSKLESQFQDWYDKITTAYPNQANAVFYTFNIFTYSLYE